MVTFPENAGESAKVSEVPFFQTLSGKFLHAANLKGNHNEDMTAIPTTSGRTDVPCQPNASAPDPHGYYRFNFHVHATLSSKAQSPSVSALPTAVFRAMKSACWKRWIQNLRHLLLPSHLSARWNDICAWNYIIVINFLQYLQIFSNARFGIQRRKNQLLFPSLYITIPTGEVQAKKNAGKTSAAFSFHFKASRQ